MKVNVPSSGKNLQKKRNKKIWQVYETVERAIVNHKNQAVLETEDVAMQVG